MTRSDSDSVRSEKHREIVVLALAPALLIALTLASWVLAHWHIGPVFLNAALVLASVFLGGTPRFVAGSKDIFRRRITVNVFVLVALAATVAIGEFRPAAVIFQEAGCVTVVISSTLLLWAKGGKATT